MTLVRRARRHEFLRSRYALTNVASFWSCDPQSVPGHVLVPIFGSLACSLQSTSSSTHPTREEGSGEERGTWHLPLDRIICVWSYNSTYIPEQYSHVRNLSECSIPTYSGQPSPTHGTGEGPRGPKWPPFFKCYFLLHTLGAVGGI